MRGDTYISVQRTLVVKERKNEGRKEEREGGKENLNV